VALVLGAVSVGLAGALAHGAWLARTGDALSAAGPREWAGAVAEDPLTVFDTARVSVRLETVGGPVVSVAWPKSERVPEYGEHVHVWTRLSPGDTGSTSAREAFLAGECAAGRAWRVETPGWTPGLTGSLLRWRAGCLGALRALDTPGSAVIASCLFGDRRQLDGSETQEAFRAAGVSYLIGGSGLHLALAVAMAMWFARLCGARPGARAVLACATALLFVAVSGWRVSLVRAGIAAAVAAGPHSVVEYRRRVSRGPRSTGGVRPGVDRRCGGGLRARASGAARP
jgi:hypothetical protein